MKKYLVSFKDPKKKFQIDAQDDKTARLWAEQQMKVWKIKTEFVITLK